jgi:hypothetical protein
VENKGGKKLQGNMEGTKNKGSTNKLKIFKKWTKVR